jgi:hypothetical protein
MRREIILLYCLLAAIVATFLSLWGGAVLFDRLKRYDDRLDAPAVP